jgi:hypothetical protein
MKPECVFDNRLSHVLHLCARTNYNEKIRVYLFIIFSGFAAQRGLWPPRPRGFLIIHNDAPQSVGLLWMNDQLIAEIST